MRVDKLELLAFGPFTNRTLDFSAHPRALQLVYGPNEAGKSSTLRALIALLYGIDARTSDAHLHDMTRLRIGATLVDELGNKLRVIRRKGTKNTLLDAAEEPIGEGALTPLLGGLDEKLFRQMFGLDHERLREGAEALLRGGGQLGEVLFDASTGGRGVHTLLDSLRAEADALYKVRGRTPELNVALESLREQRKLKTEAMLSPHAFVEQQEALAETRAQRDQAVSYRRELAAEKSRLSRLLQLVPVLAKRDLAAAELAALREARPRATPQVTPQVVPQVITEGLDELVRELNRRYGSVLASERDQPQERAHSLTLERQVEELRASLGALAPLHGLETATRARLRKLVEAQRSLQGEHAELQRADASAGEEQARLQARLAELSSMSARAPEHAPSAPSAKVASEVAALLADLEREELVSRLAHKESELDKLGAQLSRRIGQLGLTLDLALLRQSALPSESVLAELERGFDRNEQERERHARDSLRLSEQLGALSQQRGELLARGELATRAELSAARSERDAAFDALFSEGSSQGAASGSLPPSAASVRAHAAATQRADALADRMTREAQESAELLRIDLSRTQLEAQRSELAEASAALERTESELRARYQALAAPFGLADHAPRVARGLWVELAALREQLLEQAELEAQSVRLMHQAEQRLRELHALLARTGACLPAQALVPAQGLVAEPGLVPAQPTAQSAMQPAAPHTPATLRRQLEQGMRQLRELHAAELELLRAREVLSAQLDKLASERAARRGRASALERELASLDQRYQAELVALGLTGTASSAVVEGAAGALGLSAPEPSGPLAPDELLACFDELTLLGTRLRELHALRDRQQAARLLRQALVCDVRAASERFLKASPDGAELSLERTLEALAQVQRERTAAARDSTRLSAELAKLDEQLVSLGDGLPLDELRVLLAQLDPHEARARVEEIDILLDEQSQKTGDLEQSIGRLSAGLERLEQLSGAGARAEDYEHELSRAQALARRYIEVRLALSLLTGQVERYRTQHQQPVLKRASELFPKLTLQRYRGLAVEYDEQDDPVLACLVSGGKSVRIGALSDGTRDQLYLALRVASIEQYFVGRPPLPLILDDALIHFDDNRAAAALDVLGQLARHTQVLFFTHHARMVDLARASLGEPTERGGVQIHELAPRAVPRSDGPLFEPVLHRPD